MSRAQSGQPDRRRPADAVGVREGRRPVSKTDIHDWVALSGASPHAIALYQLLRMHVNRGRADDVVWTSTLTLAVMMGLSRGDKIAGYLKELRDLQAIRVVKGENNKNIYEVHQLPPDGYTGPTNLRTWYALHRPLIDAKREEEKRVRDARRARKKDSPSAAEPGGAVTPETGEPVAPKTGQRPGGAVTPETGEPVAPDPGEPVAPFSGREPPGSEPPGSEPPPTPALSNGHRPRPEGLSEQEQGLIDELIPMALTWSPSELADVLTDPLIRERPWELVRRAFQLAAGDGGRTWTPRRLLAPSCPHWRRAAKDLRGDGDQPAARPRPPRRLPWCRQPDCDPTTRQVLDEDGHPTWDLQAEAFRTCPRCGPTADPAEAASRAGG